MFLISLKAAALVFGAIVAVSPALAQTKWNFPVAYTVDNYTTQEDIQFAKDVAEATGGKLQITVHPNASLFKGPEIKRAVQTGQAQIGEVIISTHENEDPIFGVDAVPFLATGFEQARKLYAAQRPYLEKKLASQGLMLLYTAPWPPQGVYAKKDLNSAADLQGLKMRAYNPGTSRIAELVGAQGVTIQAAELPQALATGVVNSFMSSGPMGYDTRIWETLTHFYDTQAWLPKNAVFVNKGAFDALDKASQDGLLKAAAVAEERVWKLAPEKTRWYLDQLSSRGLKVLQPSPTLASDFRKIGDQLTADWLKRAGPDGQALVDSYRKM